MALQLLDAQHRSLPVVADGEQATLLFFFATYDGVSQAALTPLRQLHSRCAQLRIVGIALQPDPGPLLEAWQAALQPPFALGYDPSGALLDGHSALGSFAVIPAYVLFERQGEQAARFDGYASERRLLALLQPLGACDVAVHDADR